MSTNITLDWSVTNQYTMTIPADQFSEWVAATFPDIDATDLDAIYERLDKDDYRANGFLHELASSGRWLDSGDTSVSDLREEAEVTA